jgi:hypothetical protein
MNRILYDNRCECNKISITKEDKPKVKKRRNYNLRYPDLNEDEVRSKVFQIKYQRTLSPAAKLIFNTFQQKYIYYAIDDILYSFQSNPIERDNLLAILYSPILSLQNDFSVNFFDIWIGEVFIDQISKPNKFLKNGKECNSIRIEFLYTTPVPAKKQKSLW